MLQSQLQGAHCNLLQLVQPMHPEIKPLTPVATILEWIDQKMKLIGEKYTSPDDMPLSVRGQMDELVNLHKICTAQLDPEKKMVEDAHKDGGRFMKWNADDIIADAAKYFTTQYRQK